MLTSERKLCKLFIKFIEWGKIAKAENLMQLNPELEFPLQKAFESAALNKMERGAGWTYELACKLSVKIDIHFDNDKLVNYLAIQECRSFIKWLLALEPNYQWKSTITSETLLLARKDTLAMLS